MRFDFSRNDVTHSIVDIVLGRNGKVTHSPTAFANEVVVLVHSGVIAANALSKIEFANLALRCKDVKVTVDGTERDTWNQLTNMLVHPFRGRVRGCAVQDLVDLIALPASFCSEALHTRRSNGCWLKHLMFNILNAPRNVKESTSLTLSQIEHLIIALATGEVHIQTSSQPRLFLRNFLTACRHAAWFDKCGTKTKSRTRLSGSHVFQRKGRDSNPRYR